MTPAPELPLAISANEPATVVEIGHGAIPWRRAYTRRMSGSGEVGLPLTPEEQTEWTEAKERANRLALALVIAFRAVETGATSALRLRAIPPAEAAIDAVEASRKGCLDLLEQLLVRHGKAKGSLDEKRRELEQAIHAEREKLAGFKKALESEP